MSRPNTPGSLPPAYSSASNDEDGPGQRYTMRLLPAEDNVYRPLVFPFSSSTSSVYIHDNQAARIPGQELPRPTPIMAGPFYGTPPGMPRSSPGARVSPGMSPAGMANRMHTGNAFPNSPDDYDRFRPTPKQRTIPRPQPQPPRPEVTPHRELPQPAINPYRELPRPDPPAFRELPRPSPPTFREPPRPGSSPYRELPRPDSSTGLLDRAPQIPPPTVPDPFYPGYRPGSSRGSPARSPTRSSIDIGRPPISQVPYEPADINGAPRPGTPSSQYSTSPKRPLPPKPLFAPARSPTPKSVHEKAEEEEEPADAAIPIDEEDDDVFGGEPPLLRPTMSSADSFETSSTATSEYDEKEYGNYEKVPEGKQIRRGAREAQMKKKEVKLVNGELVLECKIPTILYSFLPRRDDAEFTHMRYTAVTCDPDDFVDRGFQLRQNLSSRETELLICVTMYNENEIDFTRTMHGVMRNIANFCSRTKSRTWGKDGWKKIVVCIIADGRKKVHPRVLDALAAMGVYQNGIAKNLVNQREVLAHMYEYTTQVSLDPDLKFKGAEKGIVPCQMIFCLKEQNQKKLNSHRWFFNAVGKSLNPNVCILLDVGTKPGNTSLYHLWKAFDNDSNVAGAAGEIKAGKGKGWLGLLNPLVASQNFEYKMSNILDKPLESVFGYITVLPGALSAYRYHALQNDETGHGPLSQYFKGETLHGQDADVFTANMYLAEDRILCWELVAKRSEKWVLKYVKSATGETDVPDSVPEFISQRRRWLNGAFFAAVYSLLHFKQIWTTDHTLARKILLHVEFVYQFISLIFTWFSLGNFYLTFYFITGSLAADYTICNVIFYILKYTCVLLIAMQFILSMGNRPQGAKKMFLTSMTVYAVIMAYTTFCSIFIVYREFTSADSSMKIGNNVFTNLIVSTLSTIGLYFLMSFLYLDPWHMFTSSAQYFAMLPSYVCTLQIYAFCNAHDISWGTKGETSMNTDLGAAKGTAGTVTLDMPSEQLDIDSGYDEALRNLRDRLEVPSPPPSASQAQEDYYRAVRTYMVTAWMASNAILAMGVSEAYGSGAVADNVYLKLILWSVAVLALFRAIGSSTFGVINIVHAVMEGRVRWKRSTEKSDKGSSVGRSTTSSGVMNMGLPGMTMPSLSMPKISQKTGGWWAGIKGKMQK